MQAQIGANGQGTQEFDAASTVKGQTLIIPNAFTPNGDGINDIYFVENKNFKEFEFSIFDRLGNQIYHTSDARFRWDGNINSRVIPADIYVFVFNGITNQGMKIRKSGTISVIY